jgi:hypothetical protein
VRFLCAFLRFPAVFSPFLSPDFLFASFFARTPRVPACRIGICSARIHKRCLGDLFCSPFLFLLFVLVSWMDPVPPQGAGALPEDAAVVEPPNAVTTLLSAFVEEQEGVSVFVREVPEERVELGLPGLFRNRVALEASAAPPVPGTPEPSNAAIVKTARQQFGYADESLSFRHTLSESEKTLFAPELRKHSSSVSSFEQTGAILSQIAFLVSLLEHLLNGRHTDSSVQALLDLRAAPVPEPDSESAERAHDDVIRKAFLVLAKEENKEAFYLFLDGLRGSLIDESLHERLSHSILRLVGRLQRKHVLEFRKLILNDKYPDVKPEFVERILSLVDQSQTAYETYAGVFPEVETHLATLGASLQVGSQFASLGARPKAKASPKPKAKQQSTPKGGFSPKAAPKASQAQAAAQPSAQAPAPGRGHGGGGGGAGSGGAYPKRSGGRGSSDDNSSSQ